MEPISPSQTNFHPALTPTITSQVVNFPTRFIGSKSESLITFTARLISGGNAPTHYHFVPQKELTPSEALDYIPYAILAHVVPSGQTYLAEIVDYDILSPLERNINLAAIPGSIQANHKRFFDKTTGLKVMMFAKENEVIFGFGPAASYQSEVSDFYESLKVGTNVWCCGVIANLAGVIPLIYVQAEALFTEIMKDPFVHSKTITLVGHSIGASMASYIALKHHIKAIGFNSLALGAGIQKEVGEYNLTQAEHYVTHLSVAGDAPSDFPFVHYIDRCVSFAGIRTPGNFGNHYRIPSSSWSQSRIHNEYLQALIALSSNSENATLNELVKLI